VWQVEAAAKWTAVMAVSDCVVDRMAAVDRMDVAVDMMVVVDTMVVEAVVDNILAVDVVGMAVVDYFELVVVVVVVAVRLLNYLSKNQPVGLEKFR
jgi:hypothetical protein